MTLNKLNLGSGDMLLGDYTNFDLTKSKRGAFATDVIGDIKDIHSIFPRDHFDEILCAHVIEHFTKKDAIDVLQKCKTILKRGGKLVIEGPDMIGMYQMYNEGRYDLNKLIQYIYGEPNHIETGDQWSHRWGFTQDTMASQMSDIGFKIKYKGIGRTHGMGNRDYRVEGIKI